MRKILQIALKDLRLAFRDRAALILMLAAPLALTVGLGIVTGRFSGGGNASGVSDIPVAVVNQDEGQLGSSLVNLLGGSQLGGLLKPITSTTVAEARALVDADKVAAAIIIPPGFSRGILPSGPDGAVGAPVTIELRISPGRPLGASIAQSVVEEFINRVDAIRASEDVTIRRLIAAGLLVPADAEAYAHGIAQRASNTAGVSVRATSAEAKPVAPFDPLAVLAPGMALLFLMYAVTRGAATVLGERTAGTLQRILVSPTSVFQALSGKMLGIFFIAVSQLTLLIVGCGLLFQLRWGDPLAVAALIAFTALAATGWGALLAAIARTPAQAGSAGTALMLAFGVLGGNFGSNVPLPSALSALGAITPNRWGMNGFEQLAAGGNLTGIGANLAALCLMAVVTLGIATLVFRRTSTTR